MASRASSQRKGSEASPAATGKAASDALRRAATDPQIQLDDLRNQNFATWLSAIRVELEQLEYQKTLSWRLTKPLRYVEAFVNHTRNDGLASALSYTVDYVRRRT